ncbi:GNAT superfamily N-acetyltransferase [Rhodovulum iodosum]|uniref:GNAT superfamily N-acetyltransferase n=1 Tax=Rhodovulum iodosum TaxID=68291 RepID=A0ABV3XQX5_9RHOB|nr:GNAT family N-acetyltransferase [Rhodovulum robiginosum]RSK39417.1 GNAT family N-acetyltransferase [Rhodovulum robiginosum]
MTETDWFAAIEATWPPAARQEVGPITVRDGQGGGKRVSAATVQGRVTEADLARAEDAMRALGQTPLYQIRGAQRPLDHALAARGYVRIDPVVVLAAPVAMLATAPPPPVSAFTMWPPLRIMEDIWAEGGIGPARLAVMGRVVGPKTALLGRQNDRAAGVAFAACHGPVALCHALEVAPAHRRQGVAGNLMRATALWAADAGAGILAALVTEENAAARALYASLGMAVVENYHYRILTA